MIRQIVRKAWFEKSKTGYRRRLAKLANYGGNYLQSFYSPEEKSGDQNFLTGSSHIFSTIASQIESSAVESEDVSNFAYDEDDIDTTGFSGSFTLHDKK